MIKLTLGNDSDARKDVQLVLACIRYMPAALRRFALHSKAGNDKHNAGEPIHHARGKSGDHEECVLRHLVDMQDIEAYIERNGHVPEAIKMLLDEATAEFWRTGVFLQELCEKYDGAPLAPAARLPGRAEINPQGDPDTRRELPHIASGMPWGYPWAIVSGGGELLGTHGDLVSAQTALDAMLGFKPINTPGEAAELAKAQGTIKVVETPIVPTFTNDKRGEDDIDYPEAAFDDFPLIADEPVTQPPDELPLERCGHMSRTRRVCTLVAQHDDRAHSDGAVLWSD